VSYLPIVSCHAGVGFLVKPHLYYLLVALLSLAVEGLVQLLFSLFSAGIIPYVAIDGVSLRGGKSRALLCHHLGLSLPVSLLTLSRNS